VDRARDELLAGAALAVDQNGRLGVGHFVHHVKHLLHLFALTDDGAKVGALLELLLQEHVLRAHTLHVERVADHHLDLVVLGVLNEVVEGALIDGLDGRLLRRVRGHDDDRHGRIQAADLLQHFHPVHPRHFDVGQDHVELARRDFFHRLLPGAHGGDVVAFLSQHDGKELAHALLVIDHQNAFSSHA
jgi:hypothetical protein